MGKKGTKIEVEARVLQVYKMICKGESRALVLQYASKEWGVTLRQACTYIERAREYIIDDFKMERDEFALEILAGLQDTRRRAIADKQYAVALGCLNRIASITGVDGNSDGRK